MREVDRWFQDLVARRTGWVAGAVFSFAETHSGETLPIAPPREPFDPRRIDLPRLLAGPVLDEEPRLLFDLPALAAWSLGRFEEHGRPGWSWKDKYPYAESLAARQGVAERPYVDLLIRRFLEDVERVRAARGRRTPERRPPWPAGKRAVLAVSHDVDLLDGTTWLSARRLFWRVMATKSRLAGDRTAREEWRARLARWTRGSPDPVWCIPAWRDLERRLGFRSTFYFFGLATDLSIEGRLYSTRHPRLREALALLADAGFEIGLHPGRRTAGSEPALVRQRRRLQRVSPLPVESVRHHHLNIRLPESWAMAARAGFSTMSDLGWDGGARGFRAGTSFPYRPGDVPGVRVAGELVEVPFHLMDRPRIDDVEGFVEGGLRMLREVKSVGGALGIDFHPHHMSEREAPGVHRAFLAIVEAAAGDSEIWIAPVTEVARCLYPR